MTDSSKPAATAAAGMPNYYNPNEPEIEAAARKIFTEYAGIPEDKIAAHVKAVREKAWSLFPYPCIGQYAFVNFAIAEHPRYAEILARLRSDPSATLLDLGCCVGQELRYLLHAGVPAAQLVGTDLEPGFFGLGHELFRDAERLPIATHFRAGDFFDADGPEGICARLRAETRNGAGFDVVYAGSFFHLFDWAEQVEAWGRAVGLLKRRRAGGEEGEAAVIFGRQTGIDPPAHVEHAAARSGTMYRHNEASFKRLIAEVAEKTGVPLRASVDLVLPGGAFGDPKDRWDFIYFSVFVDE